MAVINVLDKQTAELIAAGEVVERPSSVVKELVENSIDAGAKNILVDIERGGIKKILVQDDGSGIDSEYVRTAFVRHATSKIKVGEDLNHIASLGFRGEALASIASVAHVTLTTKTEDQDFGIEIKLSAGEEDSFDIVAFVTGSRFVIRDLFYNTPARMKFLKKDTTEAGYVQDIVTNLAISRPDISFTFVRDGKEVFSTIGDGNLLNTAASLFDTEFAGTLVPVDYDDGKYKVTGFTTYPHASRQSRNMQYAFVNSRLVKNKTIIAAAENAYKGTVMSGKFPGYMLDISMPFDAVDVNVHPAKTEVRFANDSEMFNAVYRAVKTAITSNITLKQFSLKQQTRFDVDTDGVKQQAFTQQKTAETQEKTENITLKPQHNVVSYETTQGYTPNEKVVEYVERYITPQITDNSFQPLNSDSMVEYSVNIPSSDDEKYESEKEYIYDNLNIVNTSAAESEDVASETNQQFNEYASAPDAEIFLDEEEEIIVVGEVFSTYIICQAGNEMVLIDKHAAHERIIYERLKANTEIDKQMLLVPVTVKLRAEEKQAIFDNISLLEDSGFEIDDFGAQGVILRGIPMYVTGEDPRGLISEIAYNLANGNKAEMSEKMDWIFRSVACRSAIKGGDRAEMTQLTRLVKDIRSKKIPLYCPHGRPVIMTISKKELEKQFGR